jgi:hypothetical protein
LKLRNDEPASNFAYNFNLRRYTTAVADADVADVEAGANPMLHGGAWVPWQDPVAWRD